MKTRITNSSLILILAACGIIFFAGCASMETNKTTSLLSTAGFRVHTPQTAKQKKFYAALPINKLERATVKGKVFYVFKDEKAGSGICRRRTGTSTVSAALYTAACRAGTGRANE